MQLCFQRIAEEKKKLGLTNKTLAERSKIGVAEETISRITSCKAGDTTLSTFLDIADGLGLKPYEAFMDSTLASEFRAFLEIKNKNDDSEAERIKLTADNVKLKELNAALTNKNAILEVKLACADELLAVYRHFTGIKQEKEEPTPSLS